MFKLKTDKGIFNLHPLCPPKALNASVDGDVITYELSNPKIFGENVKVSVSLLKFIKKFELVGIYGCPSFTDTVISEITTEGNVQAFEKLMWSCCIYRVNPNGWVKPNNFDEYGQALVPSYIFQDDLDAWVFSQNRTSLLWAITK